MSEQRSFIGRDEIRLLTPPHVALSVRGLFPRGYKIWSAYASDSGYLRIRPSVTLGAIGVQGNLALGIPPSEEDVDAWEASRPAGHWDYYGFLSFVTIPTPSDKEAEVVIFIRPGNLFDAPARIVARLKVPTSKWERSPFLDEDDEEVRLRKKWKTLEQAISKEFGTASLKAQKWTVGESVFDVTAPDS